MLPSTIWSLLSLEQNPLEDTHPNEFPITSNEQPYFSICVLLYLHHVTMLFIFPICSTLGPYFHMSYIYIYVLYIYICRIYMYICRIYIYIYMVFHVFPKNNSNDSLIRSASSPPSEFPKGSSPLWDLRLVAFARTARGARGAAAVHVDP